MVISNTFLETHFDTAGRYLLLFLPFILNTFIEDFICSIDQD
jgi:hypothetical protein